MCACVRALACVRVWVGVCCAEPRLLVWQMFHFIQMKMANNTVCSLVSGVWWIRVLALSLPCASLHMLLRNDTHQTTSRHVKQTLRGELVQWQRGGPQQNPSFHPAILLSLYSPLSSVYYCLIKCDLIACKITMGLSPSFPILMSNDWVSFTVD